MAAGSSEQHFVFSDFVNQYPIGFDVQVPFRLPVTHERVRFVARLERLPLYQLGDNLPQLAQILTAFDHPFGVAPKRSSLDDFSQGLRLEL